jgi:lambda family phage tail tape measure protein
MALISRLGVVLGIDTAEFQAGLGKAQTSLNTFGKNVIGSRLGVAAIAAGLTAAAVSAVRFADQINDVSKSSELSVQTILRLNQALMTSGGNSESAAKFVGQFEKSIYSANHQGTEAQKAFAKLGVSMSDLKKLSNEALLDKTISGFKNLTEATERAGVANTLFARSARGIDFRGVADDLDKTINSYKNSQQAFEDLGNALDNLDRISFTLKTGFATNLGGPLKAITDAFISAYNWIALANQKLDEFLGKFAKFKDMIPLFWFTPNKEIATGADVKADKDSQDKIDREQELSKEYETQKKSLEQQLATLKFDVDYIGKQRSKLAEVSILFEKNGKFETQRGTQLEKNIKAMAAAYDVKMQFTYYTNESRIKDIEIERLQLQAQMAGMSDKQQKILLEQFDTEMRLQDLQRKGVIDATQAAELYGQMKKKQNQDEVTLKSQQTFSAGWSKAYEEWVEQSENAAALGKQAFESMTQSLSQALDEFVKTGKLNFRSLIGDMIQQLIRLQLQAQLSGILKMIGGAFGLGGGMGKGGATAGYSGGINFSSFASPLKFADGGSPPVGTASLVGEKGPELFIPRQSGTIIPNNSLSSMMGSQPQIVYNGPYIQNMSAIDTQSSVQFLSNNKQAVWAANQSAQRSLPQSR